MNTFAKSPSLAADRHWEPAEGETRLRQGGRPRLLVVAQLPPPAHGAALVNAQVVKSRRLASAFDITVVPIAMIEDLRWIRRFELAKVARSLGLFWSVTRRLWGATRPDLVYFTLSPGDWAFYRDLVLVALLRSFGVRHVFHLHGRGVAAAAKASWKRVLYRFAFARAHVVVLGELLYRDVEAVVGRDRIFIVPNGVADVRATEHSNLRSGAHLAGRIGAPKVFFLSNMLTAKGPLVLLDALAVLAKRNVPFAAVFAGAWRGEISAEGFFERVRELGLDDRVTHRGPLYGEEKTQAFAQADVFALPTYNDALPLVVIEAMMHGLPVVTTHIGALPELVASGETGELVEPNNVPELARALERLLESAELRMQYGAAARAKFEAELTDVRFEERLVDSLYRALAPAAADE
jgi:glycosyltransferase involved in cell wall biosynthesis